MDSKPDKAPRFEASAKGTPAEAIASQQDKTPFSLRLSLEDMKATAKKIRRHIVTMTGKAASGLPGGSLSATDIVTVLYFHVM
ncbi:MAG: hypothetical protein HYX82_03615, partial [Chloroflexi bacterium]|nr:hypothetical protein [Chloroflexota bacterium]